MNVTIIGTGNMARGLGERLIAGGHGVTVLEKELDAAEAVVGDIEGGANAGRSGDPISDDVVVLAVYYPDAQAAVAAYGSSRRWACCI
jgi:predicted dinucleotide-binding enzyme